MQILSILFLFNMYQRSKRKWSHIAVCKPMIIDNLITEIISEKCISIFNFSKCQSNVIWKHKSETLAYNCQIPRI